MSTDRFYDEEPDYPDREAEARDLEDYTDDRARDDQIEALLGELLYEAAVLTTARHKAEPEPERHAVARRGERLGRAIGCLAFVAIDVVLGSAVVWVALTVVRALSA